jgi:hypothetical protein
LRDVVGGRRDLLPALADYEQQMIDYGFAAVRASLAQMKRLHTTSAIKRFATKALFRLLQRRDAASTLSIGTETPTIGSAMPTKRLIVPSPLDDITTTRDRFAEGHQERCHSCREVPRRRSEPRPRPATDGVLSTQEERRWEWVACLLLVKIR